MSDLASTFAALGEPTRFAIVERLLREGELNAGTLLKGVHISAPAISRHLKVLRNAGIVVQRIDKQQRIYSVRPETVQAISAWTMSHKDFWQASFDRLAAILDKETDRI